MQPLTSLGIMTWAWRVLFGLVGNLDITLVIFDKAVALKQAMFVKKF